ncbi:hypothetical protein [Elioraea rosea]|uniref:hypothetical protein n=1 Tax=Elioraea rosea TaxID=2492390 RepID=UPI001182E7C7|nr:hypothetical protein [Elioraea rosea]
MPLPYQIGYRFRASCRQSPASEKGVGRCLLALLFLWSPGCAGEASLPLSGSLVEECVRAGGTYGVPAERTIRIGRSYTAILPAVPGCMLHLGQTTVFRIELGHAEARALPHFANLAWVPGFQTTYGPIYTNVAELRSLLERDVLGAVSRGGTGELRGQLLRVGQSKLVRLLDAEIGADIVETGCVPVRTRSAFSFHPAFPQGTVAEQRVEERFCTGPPGETAEFNALEIFSPDDPGATRRSARAQAIFAGFFGSSRLVSPREGGGRAAGDQADALVRMHELQCRLRYNGHHHAGPVPELRMSRYAMTVPGTGWCEIASGPNSSGRIFVKDLTELDRRAGGGDVSLACR